MTKILCCLTLADEALQGAQDESVIVTVELFDRLLGDGTRFRRRTS